METKEKSLTELKEAASPLIKYLCDNYDNPHITAIVTPTGVELLQGIASVQDVMEFVKD